MNNYSGLSDIRSYLQVLGSILQNHMLLDDVDRPLESSDFDTNNFYKMIFVSIYNLYQSGVEKIDEYAIDSYLSKYPEQYEEFQTNKGIEWVSDAREMAEISNYDYYYHRVKKFALLRYYESQGLDTSHIYDYSKSDDEEEQRKFDTLTEQTIVEKVETVLVIDPKAKYCNGYNVQTIQAGEGMNELIDGFLETPDYGYPLTSMALNTICRGLRRGKLYIRIAATSTGKTRQFLMDACNLAVPYTYDLEQKKFVYTGNNIPTLFYGTEGSLEEFQSIVLACVSGVDEKHILMGQYKAGEIERVRKASEYISAAPLYLIYCDDYTATDIENTAKKFFLQKNIEVFIFDYIQTSPKLVGEINKKASIKYQEWQILIQLAARLRALAERLDIAILTGAQTKVESKDARYKDETILSGSRGISQKVDCGITISKPTPAEKQKIEKITRNMIGCPEINLLQWCWKVRRGSLVSIIVASNINLGNLRLKDVFVMDYDFNLINIDFTKIEQVEETIKENSRELKPVIVDEEDEEVEEEEEETLKPKFDW